MTNTRNVVPLVAARVVTLGLQIASIRTYVRVLGDDAYAVFVYFTAIMGYVLLVDLGILSALQRELLEVYAKDERWAIRRTIKDGAKMLALSLVAGWGVYAVLAVVLKLPFSETVRVSMPLMALFGGVHLLGNLTFLFLNAVLAGAARFRRLGVSLLAGGAAAPALGIVGAYVSRSPQGVVAGTSIGFCLAALTAFVLAAPIWKQAPHGHEAPPRTRSILQTGIRGFASRVSAQFGTSIDRILIGNTVPTVLTPYALCYQVAQLLQELLVPVYQTMFPEISRAMVKGPKELSIAVERTVLIGVSFASSMILVGSAYGDPILRLWVSKEVEYALWTTLLLGVYRSADFLNNIIGIAHFSAARMDRLIPYTATNATLTIALTAFAVRGWGIVGVGVMNAAISTLILVPLLYGVKRRYAPDLALRRLFAKSVGMVAVAGVFVGLVGWGTTFVDSTRESLWLCLTAPFAVGGCYLLQVKLCGAPYPKALANKILAKWQRDHSPAPNEKVDSIEPE